MKRLTAILFAFGLALMARAETRLGDVVMKDVVVLEPVDKTNLLNTVNALTNGAALGATALQPPATNTLAAAAAHAATAHGVTQDGGFQGGSGAQTIEGGAVGYGAQTIDGGAVGSGAYTEYGGAVGAGAYTEYGGAVGSSAYTEYGGAVGLGAQTMSGGAVGLNATTSDGFAGGKNAFATTDGNLGSPGIDAIQLGTGGNSEPFSLQIYSHKLMHADGTIPVERMSLYASTATNIVDSAVSTHNTNGLAHADIRALIGGASGSIVKPIIPASATVAVTSTQSVYSVAVTGAGPVGIDWSGLALDGAGRAEVTLRLNVTDWGGTNVTFSPALTFDRTPEILVTGVWEFAASTVDGVATRIRQTWPECCAWEHMTGFAGTATYGSAGQPSFDATTDIVYVSIPNDGRIVRTVWTTYGARYVPERGMLVDIGIPPPSGSIPEIVQAGFTNRLLQGSLTQTFVGVAPSVGSGAAVFLRIRPDGDTATWTVNGWLQAVQTRPMNSNERATYAAGWRP